MGLLGLGLILAGCGLQPNGGGANTGGGETAMAVTVSPSPAAGETTTNEGEVPTGEGELPSYTLDEIAKHNQANDCWMAIEGQVYDVTSFIPQHPGGRAILEGCGKDATELFNTRPMGSGTAHSERARAMHPDYLIGKLAGGS
jgi:predicted heme/steroid binding protein